MLAFKNWLVATIVNDTQMQTLLNATASTMPVYPTDVDIQPEVFPANTYKDAGVTVLSRPQGMHVGIIQLDLWSTTSAIEVETIYERLGQLLNFKDSTTQSFSGALWWIRENGVRDQHTPSRRLWNKQVDLKFWASKADNT